MVKASSDIRHLHVYRGNIINHRTRLFVLVSSQGEPLRFNAIFRDDVKFDVVTRVDVALGGGNEDVLDQVDGLFLRQGRLLHILHVLEANLKSGIARALEKKTLTIRWKYDNAIGPHSPT